MTTPVTGEGGIPQPAAEVWLTFGQAALRAHHRHRATAQCVCGSLLEYCAVIVAAQQLKLPIEDPGSPEPSSRGQRTG